MSKTKAVRAGACLAMLCAVMLVPVAGASASSASIKSTIKSYSGKIDIAEGHVVSAIGEYKTSKDPSGVQAAIAKSETVLRALKAKVAAQGASSPKVKRAKREIVAGLQAVVAAYEKLSTAFGENTSSPEAAITEANKALAAVKTGRKQLLEGVKLLG